MKAAVCYEFGKPLVIEDVNLDPPAKGQVKVKFAATAICHSDIHALRGELPFQPPMVAGHESAGYVDSVGQNVESVKAGDTVLVSLISSCGYCKNCMSGKPHICETIMPLDTNTPISNKKGQRLANFLQMGSFAEYGIVDQSQVVKIPKDMPMDRAALLSCGVITGFGAVVNRAQVKSMSSVVVIGAGGVGLNAIQGAAFSGAYPVIAVDVLDSKLKAAMDFGATHTVNSKKGNAIDEVMKLTSGRGADNIFITVGRSDAIAQGLQMSARRGATYIIGLPSVQDTLTLVPLELIKPEKILTGAYMGSTNLQVDIPMLISLYKAKKLKLDELVTKHYSLEQINEAIASVEKGEALRNIIMFK